MSSRSPNSSRGSHNRSNIGAHNSEIVTCDCGIVLRTLTSKTKKNPGRRFRACPNYKSPECCGYFEWVDEKICVVCKDVVPGLLSRVDNLDEEIKLEKERKRKLKIQLQLYKKKQRNMMALIVVLLLLVAMQLMLKQKNGKNFAELM